MCSSRLAACCSTPLTLGHSAFGRLNGYTINPNQELIAIGVTNAIGSVFGAYPATGSFSRTALKSQSGVRTPAAGIVTAVVVIVALYGLTPAFYWIPTAGLSAVIIHAVADLVASPSQVYSYWRISPLEFLIWAAAVLVTVFSNIENGIYTSIAASGFLLLVRLAHPRIHFLGKVTVQYESRETKTPISREVFVPLNSNGLVNPNIRVSPPAPGVIIYRFEEGLLYPNASLANRALVEYVKANTSRGINESGIKPSDRPWNDPGPRAGSQDQSAKPSLYAVVLDFTTMYVCFFSYSGPLVEHVTKAHRSTPLAFKAWWILEMKSSDGLIMRSRSVDSFLFYPATDFVVVRPVSFCGYPIRLDASRTHCCRLRHRHPSVWTTGRVRSSNHNVSRSPDTRCTRPCWTK